MKSCVESRICRVEENWLVSLSVTEVWASEALGLVRVSRWGVSLTFPLHPIDNAGKYNGRAQK